MELLQQEYNAKLSDFGLAKAGPQGDKTHVSTRVVGTYGYAAPEYVMTGETFQEALNKMNHRLWLGTRPFRGFGVAIKNGLNLYTPM